MIEFLISKMHDARFMTMLLAAIAASATAYTLIIPLFAGEGLAKRMKAVASERERLRQRERDRLAKSEKVSLRQTPKQLVSKVVEDFNLTKWLAQEAARDKLIMAGYRGHAPYVTFLFARAVTPIVLFLGAALYVFVITHMDKSLTVKLGICVAAAYLGLQAPMLFLKNAISKRQLSGGRAGADAVGTLRHPARPEPARDGAGKPRHADERGREEGGRAAAEADRADDPVLPALPVHRHSRADLHQAPDDELRRSARRPPAPIGRCRRA